MATTKLNIGKIPLYKGEYVSGTVYQKLNQVSLLGSTYQSKIDDNASAPAQEKSDGTVEQINTDKWDCIAYSSITKKEIEKRFEKVIGRTSQYSCLRDKFIINSQDHTFQLTSYDSGYIFTAQGSFMIPSASAMTLTMNTAYTIIYLLEDLSGIGQASYNETHNIPDGAYIIALVEHFRNVIYCGMQGYIVDGESYSFGTFKSDCTDLANKLNHLNLVSSYSASLNRPSELVDNGDGTFTFTLFGTIQYGINKVVLQSLPNGKSITFEKKNFLRVTIDIYTLEMKVGDWADKLGDTQLLVLQFGTSEVVEFCIGGSYLRDGFLVDGGWKEVMKNRDTVSSLTDTVSSLTDTVSSLTDTVSSLKIPYTTRDALAIFTEKESEGEADVNYIGFTNYWYCFWGDSSVQYQKTKVELPEQFYSNFYVTYLKNSEKPPFNQEWPVHVDLYNKPLVANSNITILAIFMHGTPIYMLTPTIVDEIKNKTWSRYQNLTDFNSAVSRIGAIEKKTGLSSSSLKYAEIGDSITFLADNKYETSYDDRGSTKTGYKGWGYGRYLCNAMGIAYENHYPQGANGRTFCDYLDEWEAGHWSFPEDVDVWTIFLGTNDWGTERHGLGTKDDYLSNTYTSTHRTTFGAMRKMVDKIRGLSTTSKKARIIFMTPLQRGAFVYGNTEAIAKNSFMQSAVKKDDNGQWEYTKNSYDFTLKDVVDAIIWVCEYESFEYIDLFNNSPVDKSTLNMAQTLDESGWSTTSTNGYVYQDTLSDNLHPSAKGFKMIGSRLIQQLRKDFYDIVAVQ